MAAPSIGNYKRQKVSVADLQLDLENFRTGAVASQTEALSTLINRGSNKIRGLLESIAENGFLDLEIPCVFPDVNNPGKYIVAEGNRRISSLKMLRTPALAKNTPLMAEIKRLKASHQTKIPLKVECAVFGSKKDCLAYVLMRHGYGSDGTGVMQWNSISKLRAHTYVTGILHQELIVLEWVVNNGTISEARRQVIDEDEVKITNLSRLTDDTQVKSLLKISKSDCTKSDNGDGWLLSVWQKIIEVIIDGKHRGEKFTVDNNINNTTQRQQFIKEIIEDLPQKDSYNQTSFNESQTTSSNSSSSTNNSDGNEKNEKSDSKAQSTAETFKGEGTTKSQPTSKRKGLISKGFKPANLKPQKVVNICDELRKIDVIHFRHCTGAMFRVFVEFGIENYIKNNVGITPKNDKFISKIQSVVDHMQTNNVLTQKQLKPVRDIVSNANHPISTETLNAYVHNAHVSPNPDTLKTEWDNIEHFVELLWR